MGTNDWFVTSKTLNLLQLRFKYLSHQPDTPDRAFKLMRLNIEVKSQCARHNFGLGNNQSHIHENHRIIHRNLCRLNMEIENLRYPGRFQKPIKTRTPKHGIESIV